MWPLLPPSFLRLAWLSVLASSVQADVVVTLTGDTFDAAIKAHPLIFVQFYAPWCQHCRSLAPDFEAAAKRLQGKVVFAKIDSTTEVLISERYGIDGYPTIALFRSGLPEEYNGPRSVNGMIEWILEAAGPTLKVVQSEVELTDAIEARGSKALFIAKGGDATKAALSKVADEFRLLAHYLFFDGWEGPQVLEVHRGLDEFVELHGEEVSNPETVHDFVAQEMLPRFGEINEDNFEGYLAKLPQGMLWVCFPPESWKQDARHYSDMFRAVAQAIPFPVVYTDTKEFLEHVKEELGCTQFPTIVLQLGNLSNEDVKPSRYKTLLDEGEMTVDKVQAFVQSVLDGKVEEDDGLDEIDFVDEESEEDSWEDDGEDEEVSAEALLAGATKDAGAALPSDRAGDSRSDL